MRAVPDPAFVLDASVTSVWAFGDEDEPYGLAVLDALEEHAAIVPPLWLWEITNVLLTAARRGRISGESAHEFLLQLNTLAIEAMPARDRLELSMLFTLAGEQNLTAYDAEYLALALETGLPLATLDHALLDAMGRVGVERFTP